jgi:hypothetical protein
VAKSLDHASWAIDNDDETFTATRVSTISAGAAIDNGDGTVGIPVVGHGYVAGEHVTIEGTINYDGTHGLPDQTTGSDDLLVITATYVAETFAGTETTAVLVSNNDGTVSLPCHDHGFVEGQEVAILWAGSYSGVYVLPEQTDPDAIRITRPFFEYNIYNATRVVLNETLDPDVDGVRWQASTAGMSFQVQSNPSNRALVRGSGSGLQGISGSGTKFNMGASAHAP